MGTPGTVARDTVSSEKEVSSKPIRNAILASVNETEKSVLGSALSCAKDRGTVTFPRVPLSGADGQLGCTGEARAKQVFTGCVYSDWSVTVPPRYETLSFTTTLKCVACKHAGTQVRRSH